MRRIECAALFHRDVRFVSTPHFDGRIVANRQAMASRQRIGHNGGFETENGGDGGTMPDWHLVVGLTDSKKGQYSDERYIQHVRSPDLG